MKRHATLASLSLSGSGPRRFAAAASLAVLLFAAAGARACEFPIVKEQIDIVLDRDARLGAEFRAQVKDGSDSVAVIESLVSAEIALIAGSAGLLSVQAALGQDEKQVEAGEAVYNDYCQTCHGANLVNSGQTFDLRKLRKDERGRFENSVTNGKNQMPPWKGVLDSEQLDAIWAYIRANANDR